MFRRCSSICLVAAAIAGSAVVSAAGEPVDTSPVFGVHLPKGYRGWQLISVAHEAGSLNDIRAIVGNDVAVKAFRNGVRPFPDGTVIVRLAYEYVVSDRNNAIFGQAQSFVAGKPTNVQVSIKNSKKYAASQGWGYGQFENGRPNPSVSLMQGCYACHKRLTPGDDLVFTHYSP